VKSFPDILILAAGFSGRMGTHKALLQYDENTNFIEKIIGSYYDAGAENVTIVTNPDLFYKFDAELKIKYPRIKVVENKYPETGRFGSIKAGLKGMAGDNHFFISNCDNPFCNPELLMGMLNVLEPCSYVVPVYKTSGGHPVLIAKTLKQNLLDVTAADSNLKEVLKPFKKIELLTDDATVLFNINTPDDYSSFLKKGY